MRIDKADNIFIFAVFYVADGYFASTAIALISPLNIQDSSLIGKVRFMPLIVQQFDDAPLFRRLRALFFRLSI